MKTLSKKIGLRLLRLALLALLGGFLCATLVRFAPGYGVDERELDPRLNAESVRHIRNENRLNSNLIAYYSRYLNRAAHGDFGKSQWLQQPVSTLIKERFGVTARSVLLGVLLAWVLAFCFSLISASFRNFALDFSGTLLSGFLIALPTAVVA